MPPKEIILMTPSFLKRISATFYRTIWGMPERLGEKTDVQSAPKSDCFFLLEAINRAKIPNNAQISQKYNERRRPRSDSIPQSI
jgi:hypothetical protein